MTRDEGVAFIQEQLGFRSDLSVRIIANMKLAQDTLEKGLTKPWFLVSEDSYIRTTAAEDRIPIPSDFLDETDQAVLRYVPDSISSANPEVDLKKDLYDVLRKNYADSLTGTIETGAPEAYALLGNYFRLFPTPDDDYLIRQIYYQQDTVLSSNVENGWLKHVPYMLLGKAGFQIATALRDMAAAQTFMSWNKEGTLLLVMQNTAREMANMDMQVGGPH